MNKEDIIRMAREADQYASANHVQWIGPEVINMDWVVARDERFAALVAAAEREACAKVCDIHARGWEMNPGQNPQAGFIATSNCAAAIRARGQA